MKRIQAAIAVGALATSIAAPAARAAINVERQGAENPVVEVARSTIYGGLAGLVLGSAFALATESNDNDGDIIRWCFFGGTMVGMGAGIYWVAHRPQPTAMLEVNGGTLLLHVPELSSSVTTQPSPAEAVLGGRGFGEVQVRVVSVRF